MKKLFLFIALFVAMFANAQTEQKLKNFEAFVNNVNLNYKTYTDTDWDKMSKTYDTHAKYFVTDDVKKTLTTEQKDRLTNIKTKYYAVKTKNYTGAAAGATKVFVKTLFD